MIRLASSVMWEQPQFQLPAVSLQKLNFSIADQLPGTALSRQEKLGLELETAGTLKDTHAFRYSWSGLARLTAGLQPTTMASSLHPVSEHAENTGSHFQSFADVTAAHRGRRR